MKPFAVVAAATVAVAALVFTAAPAAVTTAAVAAQAAAAPFSEIYTPLSPEDLEEISLMDMDQSSSKPFGPKFYSTPTPVERPMPVN